MGFFFQESWESDVFVSDWRGNNTLNLTSDIDGHKQIVSISPDQQWLIIGQFEGDGYTYSFSVPEASPIDLWLIKMDGSFKKLLVTGTPESMRFVQWSLDSKYFIFTCNEGDFALAICITDVDKPEVIHTSNLGDAFGIASDGKAYAWQQIASVAEDGFGYLLSEWIVKTETGNQEPMQIGKVSQYSHVSPLIWSADGQNIIFAEGTILYNLQVDNSAKAKLCDLGHKVSFIEASPERSYLLISNFENDKWFDVANMDCSNLVHFKLPTEDWIRPYWTPDGKHIVIRSSNLARGGDTVFVVDPITGEISECGKQLSECSVFFVLN